MYQKSMYSKQEMLKEGLGGAPGFAKQYADASQ